MQGHLEWLFCPPSGYACGKQKWEGRLKAIKKIRQGVTVWSPEIMRYFFHRSCFWAAFPSSGCKIHSCCCGRAAYLPADTLPGNPQLYSDFVGFLGCPLCTSDFPFRQSHQPKFQETTTEAVVTSQRIMSNEVAW